VLAKNPPGVRYKKREWYLCIILPVCREKVVIEKINQHAPVKTEGFIEPPLAPKKMPVLACKGINFPV
jgi:hypothetical protein